MLTGKEYLNVNFRATKRALFLPVTLIALNSGCVRQADFATDQPPSQERALPFHKVGNAPPIDSEGSFPLADLVSGTPLPVHVQAPLSSARCRTGNTFMAILDQPLVLRGQVVASKGSMITGKILEAKPSDPPYEAGYLRLTLTGILLHGKTWPLQTSHVFVKGATYEREAPVVAVQLAAALSSLSVPGPATRYVRIHGDAGVPTDRQLIFRFSQASSPQNAGGQ